MPARAPRDIKAVCDGQRGIIDRASGESVLNKLYHQVIGTPAELAILTSFVVLRRAAGEIRTDVADSRRRWRRGVERRVDGEKGDGEEDGRGEGAAKRGASRWAVVQAIVSTGTLRDLTKEGTTWMGPTPRRNQ
ncbi:hypothetical protein KM043_005181 [Ampulex compressa]|nr:hypothetical protein KM043_005181 [Ampulex compressa]